MLVQKFQNIDLYLSLLFQVLFVKENFQSIVFLVFVVKYLKHFTKSTFA